MRKLIALVGVMVFVASGIAFAAVTTGTFGDQNSNKLYRMQVDTDGIIYTPQDTNIGMGTAVPQTRIDVGGFSKTNVLAAESVGVKGDTEVDGKIYADGAIYYNSAAGYFGNINVSGTCRALYVSSANTVFTRTQACP